MFGSTLKETAGPDSDVPPRTRGLLVDFEAGATPTFLDMAEIELDLSALLGGRRVDLRTASCGMPPAAG